MRDASIVLRLAARLCNGLAVCLLASLTACGGGASTDALNGTPGGSTPPVSTTLESASISVNAAARATTEAEAYRFLRQATFGPTPASARALMGMSYGDWLQAQWATPSGPSHLAVLRSFWALDPERGNHTDHIVRSWWGQALYGQAQLRHRVAFTLSEIMVVSSRQVSADMAASYLDTLTTMADARYRDLLEAVSLHPAMGVFLSSLFNQREDPATGRMPDENYAREVMQLFSIGLYDLGDDGRPTLDAQGRPRETFGIDDVRGLAKVFTGWSWARPAWVPEAVPWWDCVWRGPTCYDPIQSWVPMEPYPWIHSRSVKQFLGTTIAEQTQPQGEAQPRASLKAALDRLATHPNTAPFISKQLIQKLVTSNPSPRYVQDVVRVWRATDGQLRAVVNAILLHPEARQPASSTVSAQTYGKVNEPLLRMTHLLRALGFTSDRYQQRLQSGQIPYTDVSPSEETDLGLGQTPMAALSVFNFYRPTFSPAGSQAARSGLVAPELQMATETANQSWPNLMHLVTFWGWGYHNEIHNRADLQPNWTPWLADADNATRLVDSMAMQILGTRLAAGRKAVMVRAIESLPSGQSEAERLDRIRAAALLLAVSPEVIVQR